MTYISEGATKCLASYVGHLSRNIVIQATEKSAGSTYGVYLVFADAISTTVTRVGSTFISGTAFESCGKTVPADPCLRFEYKTAFTGDNAPTKSVRLSHGIGSYNTFGLVMQNNVVHRSFHNSIVVDANLRQITVDNNFVIGNLRSPDYTNEWIQPFAGIYIQTTKPTVSQG
jgi:hypothetical protein